MLGNIKYENVRVEMSRNNISKLDISRSIGMNRDTLSRKLSGKAKLYLNEAFEIRNIVSPNMDVTELFKEDADQAS